MARLVDAVATVGISPALASRLKAEEAALDALRKKLTKLRVRAAAVPPDDGAEEAKGWLRALVADLGMKDPDRLRATFARAFGPLVLTPCPEGYRVAGNIKAPEIRVGSGGLSPSNSGCGGAQRVWQSPAPATLSFFMPRLRGPLYGRGPAGGA